MKNKTKNILISKDFKLCKSAVSKAKGLMFEPQFIKPVVMVFSKMQKVSLHMCFVNFAIDVVYLDADKKVVEIVEGFDPWCFYNPKRKAKYVIELESGTVSRCKIEVGDKIIL